MLVSCTRNNAKLEACDEAYLAWHNTMRDILPDASRAEFLCRSGIRQAMQEKIKEYTAALKNQPPQLGL